MTTTQLGAVAVDPKQSDTPRPRHRQQSGQGDSSPHLVLDALLNNMRHGRALQLANEINVSKQTVWNYRQGKVRMTVDTVKAIAAALAVPPELFMGHHHQALKWLMVHGHPDFPRHQTPDSESDDDVE